MGQVVPILQNCAAACLITAVKARGLHKSCGAQFGKSGRVCPTFRPRGTTPVRRNSTFVPKFRIMYYEPDCVGIGTASASAMRDVEGVQNSSNGIKKSSKILCDTK